jgi:hypothetical protein
MSKNEDNKETAKESGYSKKKSFNNRSTVMQIDKVIQGRYFENKTKTQAALDAGYPIATARKVCQLEKSKLYKEREAILLKALEDQRNKAIKQMGKTVDQAKYHQATSAVLAMTNCIQLIQGKPTSQDVDSVNINIFLEPREQLPEPPPDQVDTIDIEASK